MKTTDMTQPMEMYCMIMASKKGFFSNKVNIKIDFGQEVKFFSLADQRLRDESGKVKNFNSVIDALN